MKHLLKLLALAVFALAISACSTTKPADTNDTNVGNTGPTAEELAAQREAEEARRRADAEAARIAALLDSTTIYFGYDQDILDAEYSEMLRLHAERMVAQNRSVILEGHADERGTPEYNLALGERRAKAVAQMLRTYGVADSQMFQKMFHYSLQIVRSFL